MASYSQDKNLVESCLEGSQGAWNQLVDDHVQLFWHVIHQVAYRMQMQSTTEDLEDICSEIFLEVLKDDFALLRRYKGQSKLSTYLCVMARRKAADEIEKRRKILIPRLSGDVIAGVKDQGISLGLREGLDKLSKDQNKALKMKYLQGMSYREIADALKISIDSVGSLLFRGKNQLRDFLRS